MDNHQKFLPYGRQSIDEADLASVTAALQADYLTTGPTVGRFEAAFAAAVGARYAVASNSGTAALHLACLALGLAPGDTVIVPSVTFLATANAARFCGAEVVFADVDPDSGRLTAEHFAAALTRAGDRKVKAVLPVHLNGHCADMLAIASLAERHGIRVVEDACHALGGAQRAGNDSAAPVGACAHSDLACFSLHPVKTMTTGEGGVTTTNDERQYQAMQMFRSHGMTRDPATFRHRELAFAPDGQANPWYYEMHALGWNYRITDFACALGESQLKKLPGFVARRRELAALYDRLLAPLAPRLKTVPAQSGDDPTLHLYAVLIDFPAIGKSRAQFMAELRGLGIGTMVHYLPVHQQPYYRDRYGRVDLPGADSYYARQLSIPLYPDMTQDDVARVVEALRRCLG
ncbi:UDP-4-amino-4,6-dideoxy-N-acetyl-beta-L-altrosamine transaminase [Dongia mobilis]|uniref:UDP-4-amino-4, 6-dideoxy-N-acetyl-beta-L-altrosamine transaminase n=1 Tax=Dongia mobilis TaxID=578943 RepID=A0A4R6WK56_9PROT|nr:UDP-4-amino-4,6-dideoxy-N-acetyl-beta-L-altrosamine transaminase [Dongia mobilis]TDQ80923.1 UDP-4-amino-4,6-dideoxy-N-acetyl-beta-L-altrosamine transaminase [Dongia mobilis]